MVCLPRKHGLLRLLVNIAAVDFIVLFDVISISLSFCKLFCAVIAPENQDLLRAQADALSPLTSEPLYSHLGLASLVLDYGVDPYAAEPLPTESLGAREDFTIYIRDGQDHIKEVHRGIYADMAGGIRKSPPLR